MSEVLAVLLPFLSVLLGAWITYAANIRQRRRTRVEDVFHDAIAAVGEAQAAHNYIAAVKPWAGVGRDELNELHSQLRREGNVNYVRAIANARTAIARASAYDEGLRVYLIPEADESGDSLNLVYARADEIMARLRRNIEGGRTQGATGS